VYTQKGGERKKGRLTGRLSRLGERLEKRKNQERRKRTPIFHFARTERKNRGKEGIMKEREERVAARRRGGKERRGKRRLLSLSNFPLL